MIIYFNEQKILLDTVAFYDIFQSDDDTMNGGSHDIRMLFIKGGGYKLCFKNMEMRDTAFKQIQDAFKKHRKYIEVDGLNSIARI